MLIKNKSPKKRNIWWRMVEALEENGVWGYEAKEN